MKHGMGTARALGHGGHNVAAEKMAVSMPAMRRAEGGMEEMPAGVVASPSQIAAMTVLTLVGLAASIVIATLFGQWTM